MTTARQKGASVFFFARIRSDAFADSGGFLDRELFQNTG
jgi:hypothetical protein